MKSLFEIIKKKKNTVFKTISIINDLLTGERILLDGLLEDLTLSDLFILSTLRSHQPTYNDVFRSIKTNWLLQTDEY
jgi:hypothetical protein